MKYLFIPTAVLAVMLGLMLWNARVVERDVEPWCETLTEASEAAAREDWATARAHLNRFQASWELRRTYYHIIIEHDELDNAEERFSRAATALEAGNGEDFAAETAALIVQLRVLAEMQGLSIENIL